MSDTPETRPAQAEPVEQTAPIEPAAPAETVPAAADPAEDGLTLTPAEAEGELAEAELEDEADIDPSEVRVFGMPRMCFHGAAFGVAGGYILSGLIGLVSDKTPSATICALICAGAGYLITKRVYDKRRAEREAQDRD